MKAVTISLLIIIMTSAFAKENHIYEKHRKGMIVDFSSKAYSYVACKPFEKRENALNLSCYKDGVQYLQPISDEELRDYKKLNWKLKNTQMYEELREIALKSADMTISKTKGYLECLAENPPLSVDINSNEKLCTDLSFQLVLDLNKNFPTFRIASALKGTKSRPNTDLNSGLKTSKKKLERHQQKIKKAFGDISDSDNDIILKASEAFTVFPYHPIESENNKPEPLTLSEAKLAFHTYKREVSENSDSLYSKEQNWLKDRFQQKNLKECIRVKESQFKEQEYRFVSYHIKSERELAIRCGNEYYKDCGSTVGIGASTFVCENRNKIKKTSSYYDYLKNTNPLRVTGSIDIERRKRWGNVYSSTLEKSPYFPLLKMSSEDLIGERDLVNEGAFGRKIKKINTQLKIAFQTLLENSINAKKELYAMEELSDFMLLDSLVSNFLVSRAPLSKADCDVVEAAQQWHKSKDIAKSLGYAGISIIGALTCPISFGVGCAVSVGSEALEVKRHMSKVNSIEDHI
jgi:hypothetical protein